ncbi:MAG: hypothetical protein ACE5KE_00450 [Methanosarcinales archaeon]
MKVVILDIPTTPVFVTPEFVNISKELKKYRLYTQKIKLEEKFKIKFLLPIVIIEAYFLLLLF